MSDLVGNPDCWFSHTKAQIGGTILATAFFRHWYFKDARSKQTLKQGKYIFVCLFISLPLF